MGEQATIADLEGMREARAVSVRGTLAYPLVVWGLGGGVAGIDQYCGQTLDELRSARGLSEATFDDIIFEKFTTVLSDGTLVPLKVGASYNLT